MWDKFCEENNLDKDACQRWFQSQCTLFRKVTHIKSGQGEPLLTERQKWARDNFDFLRDHIVRHLTAISEFRAPKWSASQASAAAASSSSRETVHMELLQDTSRPKSTCDPSDISHQDTHTPTTRSRAVSVTSSLADSDLQSALAESQMGITELKDIVVKKFGDNPRLEFCDFLKVEVVQLTSGSYDKFQQETFNLYMRLKHRDKQRYQHGIGTSMAQTFTYSQALMSHHYPVSRTQMQAAHHQMQQTFTHILQGLSQQQLQHSQHHFQQTFTQSHAPAQQQSDGQALQQSLQQQLILTHQPIQQQQQPTQQHSQQTSQQQTSQSNTSSQLCVMSPPVTTPDIRYQGCPPLTNTPTG